MLTMLTCFFWMYIWGVVVLGFLPTVTDGLNNVSIMLAGVSKVSKWWVRII